jgi:hypothetical protein
MDHSLQTFSMAVCLPPIPKNSFPFPIAVPKISFSIPPFIKSPPGMLPKNFDLIVFHQGICAPLPPAYPKAAFFKAS